jgi:3-oxosteroid 1-dehydrogenase
VVEQDSGVSQWNHSYDIVVVGSGAGGMTAALAAKASGLNILLIEKAGVFGGSTALSGGGVWVPNAPQLHKLGRRDDPAMVLAYLKAIAGDKVDQRRLARYVEEGPAMMAFLDSTSAYLHDAFFWSPGYSDYFPAAGGNPKGSGLWSKPIDRRKLGELEGTLRGGRKGRLPGLPRGMWVTSVDLHSINRIRWKVGGIAPYATFLRLGWRLIRSRVLGERIAANGTALAIRLRLALRDAGVPVWLSTPLDSLIVDDAGRVAGVLVQRDARQERIEARRGVVIATGGFEWNYVMRQQYQPIVGRGWSRASKDNTGDGIRAGHQVGAALDLMDDAWWYPVIAPTDADTSGASGGVAERQYPGQFIVNGAGKRYVNEAAPYTEFGHAQLAGEQSGVRHIPSWMIIDTHSWTRNIICGHFPGAPMPNEWIESGHVKKANTLVELAAEIDVPPVALVETADRFNHFARNGVDEDFGRGNSPYDNYYGDPSRKNPNLAEVKQAPFYAFRVFPGDLGTKGGLLVNDYAQVIRPDGSVIEGLYACGNASSAVMGTSYAGPGATIGSAMIFGWVAARHIAGDTYS